MWLKEVADKNRDQEQESRTTSRIVTKNKIKNRVKEILPKADQGLDTPKIKLAIC